MSKTLASNVINQEGKEKKNKTKSFEERKQNDYAPNSLTGKPTIKQKLKTKTSLIGGTEAKDNVNRTCRFSIYETEY